MSLVQQSASDFTLIDKFVLQELNKIDAYKQTKPDPKHIVAHFKRVVLVLRLVFTSSSSCHVGNFDISVMQGQQ
ncbi:hypothetical protein L6164_009843 [Bauhinia variegata]|uniref:Uncharacterized protein n=1 Tax=Bauhinia variegata TaxID=167791 RepID=A0ACB9PKC8_BAUVA|nr:hypothetical protein L6164_009843 [Bauhinia variegata]